MPIEFPGGESRTKVAHTPLPFRITAAADQKYPAAARLCRQFLAMPRLSAWLTSDEAAHPVLQSRVLAVVPLSVALLLLPHILAAQMNWRNRLTRHPHPTRATDEGNVYDSS